MPQTHSATPPQRANTEKGASEMRATKKPLGGYTQGRELAHTGQSKTIKKENEKKRTTGPCVRQNIQK